MDITDPECSLMGWIDVSGVMPWTVIQRHRGAQRFTSAFTVTCFFYGCDADMLKAPRIDSKGLDWCEGVVMAGRV